jgi:DNA-binding PadR family transcriptional regulator
MEREGLVSSTSEKREGSKVVRRYYKPTETGLRALEEGKAVLRRTIEMVG